jgi:hypothetical protein
MPSETKSLGGPDRLKDCLGRFTPIAADGAEASKSGLLLQLAEAADVVLN